LLDWHLRLSLFAEAGWLPWMLRQGEV
jgi:hypothetical protein